MDGNNSADYRYNSQPGEDFDLTVTLTCFLFLRWPLKSLFYDMRCKELMSIISQVKGCGETNCGRLLAAPIQGYLLGILSACLSALAGVYTEYLMKKNQDSLFWQNMQLYS